MKAIILAYSETNKLTPISIVKPVPLLKINGKSNIRKCSKYLKKSNIDDITVIYYRLQTQVI